VRHVPLLLLLMLHADLQQRVEAAVVATTVVATSVPLCNAAVCPPREEQGAGLLRFKGGLHLTSTNRDFGGLSAIRVAAYPVPASSISTAESHSVPSELQFVAVSDSATLVTGKLETDRNGWLIAMSNVTTGQLLNIDGKPLVGMDAETMLDLQDAESLAATSDTDPLAGDLLVSFERLHRVYRYSMAALGVAAIPVEQAGLGAHNGRISQCEENGGVEAMDFLHDGALLVWCEEPLSTAPTVNKMLVSPGWLLPHPSTSSTAYCMQLLLSTDERPVAMARIPMSRGATESTAVTQLRGGVLLLLRSYNPQIGNVLRIVFVDATTLAGAAAAGERALKRGKNLQDSRQGTHQQEQGGCVVQPSLVAELNRSSHNVDNFEGLALVALAGSLLRVYIVSDDNFRAEQRTLLHSFELDLADLVQLPPSLCVPFFHDFPSCGGEVAKRQGPANWVSAVAYCLLAMIICALVGVVTYKVRAQRRNRYSSTQSLPTEEL